MPDHSACLSGADRPQEELIHELAEVRSQLAAKEQQCLEMSQALTRSKRVEEALARQRELLQLIFDSIPASLVLWDRQLQRFTLNRHAETVLGWTTADANQGDFMSKVCPDADYRARVVAYMHSLEPGWREWFVTTRDAGQIPMDWANIRLNNDLSVGIGVDQRERKRSEEALRQLNETLEQRVAERTELAEARAKQLQALAVELIEAEEGERQRIAQLLHDDLQQVLASARLQLQAACENLPPEPMLANVERLLSESIVKSRRLSHELSPAVLHHSGLIPALEWLIRQMHEQFGLHVQLDTDAAQQFESGPLKVFLFRAVQELLFNVVKHAGVKSARVLLSGASGRLLISISDQGQGFDPEVMNSAGEKSGFGLLRLRERARSIGGDLVVASAAGQGSRFTLMVPLSLPVSHPSQVAEPEAEGQFCKPAGQESNARMGCTRVLFVDDHKVMRQGLIRLIAGQPDIQVVGEASNGREALERVRQVRPDVVVMDISMPEMDGVEATRRIKAEWPEVRVIGLSMFEDEQIARSMRQAGAESLLSKTASSAELLKALYGIARREKV